MKKNLLYVTSMALMSLIGVSRMEAQVTIGQDMSPANGALLDLKQNASSSDNSNATKGMLFPRVNLFDDDELYPMFTASSQEYNTTEKKAAAKKAHVGLTVYNVGTNNNFVPGLYVWDGDHWVRPVTKLPEVHVTRVNSVDLQTEYTPAIADGTGANGAGGTDMNFGTITIPETGSYAFSFRFYGRMPNNSYAQKTSIYTLSIWANSSTYSAPPSQNSNLRDIAEIDMPLLAYSGNPGGAVARAYTYSITMGGYFNKGEIVKVKMTNYDGNPSAWTLAAVPSSKTSISAARTSMLWWQL